MVAIADLEDTPERPDFRRANGAPMVVDHNGKNIRLSRPSSWGKVLDDENALVNWKIDRAAIGVALDKALQARYSAVKDGDRNTLKKLREEAINAGRGAQAADIGTALHAMSERWEDPDDDFEPPEEFRVSLQAYSDCLARHGLRTVLTEYQVVNLARGCAGTADRLYELMNPLVDPAGGILPVGTLIVGDLKTGKSLDFSLPGYCIQMSLYSEGERYDVVNDEFLETPKINQDWGLLVHMPAGGSTCELIWIDLGAGAWGATLVAQVKEWRRKWKNVGPFGAFPVTPPMLDVTEHIDGEVLDEGAEWAEMMTPFIVDRMRTIGEHPKAREHLLRKWPAEIAPPQRQQPTSDQCTTLLNLFDSIEAEYGLPFPSGDPRVPTGVHQDATTTHNVPGEAQKVEAQSGS